MLPPVSIFMEVMIMTEEEKKEMKERITKSSTGTILDGHDFEFIGENDDLEFECLRCGECCKNRDGNDIILLSPLDLYNGAKALGMTVPEFAKEYANFYTGQNSGVLLAHLQTDDNGTCKLLEFDENGLAKCKIHKNKPIICAIHPLGIMHAGKSADGESFEKQYILAEHCQLSRHGVVIKAKDIIDNLPGTDEEIDLAMKVRTPYMFLERNVDYYKGLIAFANCLSTLDLTDEQKKKFGVSERLISLCQVLRAYVQDQTGLEFLPDPGNVNDDIYLSFMEMSKAFARMNLALSYLEYDTDKPFLDQVKAHIEEMKEFMENFKGYCDSIEGAILSDDTEVTQDKKDKFYKVIEDFGKHKIVFGGEQ